MVDGLLAKFGHGIVPLNCYSLFASGLPVLSHTGFPPAALCEEILDKVSVMNPKKFPVSQTNSMFQVANFCRGSTKLEDLERLPADWERETTLN